MLSPLFFVSSDTQRISSLLQLNLLPSEGGGVTSAVPFLTEGRPFHSAVLDFDDIPPFVFVVSTSSGRHLVASQSPSTLYSLSTFSLGFQYVLFRIAVEKLFFLIDRQPEGIMKVKCFTATLKRIVGGEHYVLHTQLLHGALKSLP